MTTIDPLQEHVRSRDIETALREAFPGASPDKEPTIGGWDYRVEVWEYTLTVSLTASRHASTDSFGETNIRFVRRVGRKTTVEFTDSMTTKNEMVRAIDRARGILVGILYELQRVCEPVQSKPRGQL